MVRKEDISLWNTVELALGTDTAEKCTAAIMVLERFMEEAMVAAGAKSTAEAGARDMAEALAGDTVEDPAVAGTDRSYVRMLRSSKEMVVETSF